MVDIMTEPKKLDHRDERRREELRPQIYTYAKSKEA